MLNKSFFFKFFIFCTVLSFFGCTSTTSENVTNSKQFLDRRIGEIKPLENIQENQIETHLLSLKDGSSVLLTSSIVDLNNENYIKKSIEASGTLTYTRDGKQIMEVQNVDILDDLTVQKSKAPAWVEYEKLGLSFKYRNDFLLDEFSNKIIFFRPVIQESTQDDVLPPELWKKHFIIFEKVYLKKDQTLFQFLNIPGQDLKDIQAAGFEKSTIGKDKFEVFKKAFIDSKTNRQKTQYYLPQNNFFYRITFDAEKNRQFEEDKNIFYEMIDSLRFVSAA